MLLQKIALICFCIASLFNILLAAPLAPTTRDGATPITAQITASDFEAIGELTGSDEDVADINANADTHGAYSQAETKSAASEASNDGAFKITLLATPEKTAESVNLEHEAIPSKILSTYDHSQKKIVELTNPIPILDTISEHEKFGNNGDMFDGISRSIVNGYEAFSNLLNTFIQKPKELARSISKGITDQLNIIGGKIVGL